MHGLALLSMAALLIPALPGGSAASDAERVQTIALHPWRFRVGWLPWQACALGDLWMAIAMVRARWLPRGGAWLVLALTAIAVCPDQYAQAVWVTRGVELAQRDPAAYLALEREIFPLTAGWAALAYTLSALAWTWCFARAGTWSRALTWLSVTTWASMGVAVVSPLLPEGVRPSPVFVSTANGLGFLQLQVWLALVTEQVLRRARPYEASGRWAPWRHPRRGAWGALVDAVANSRLVGTVLEPLPEPTMKSDISRVVYVSYVVPASSVEHLVPPGLELQRLGPEKDLALFTFLTYQHGHFGFAVLGPLRRVMPSPVQTNWRIHVRDPVTGHEGITFVTNAITNLVQAMGARLMSEGMPMHLLRRGEISEPEAGRVVVTLDPGEGSGPDARLELAPSDTPELRGAWAACWPDFKSFVAYCVPQDRAMASQPLRRRVSRQEIDLGIPLEACEPLSGSVSSRAAEAIVGDAEPVCFYVRSVSFTFSLEAHDARDAAPT